MINYVSLSTLCLSQRPKKKGEKMARKSKSLYYTMYIYGTVIYDLYLSILLQQNSKKGMYQILLYNTCRKHNINPSSKFLLIAAICRM
jgi:hypothetical protein